MGSPQQSDPIIHCAFLRMARPDTTNLWRFARDCHRHGLGLFEALLIGAQVVHKQQGLIALLRGRAPNLYALDSVPDISHRDLYLSYLPDMREQALARSVEGHITLQDLTDMKSWVAEREKVPISDASKIETLILFIRAGGDLETGQILAEDALLLMEGREPHHHGFVNMEAIKKARRLTSWP